MADTKKWAHRIAFNCDLFLTIETDSPDTDMLELERLAVILIRERARGPFNVADDAFTDLRLDVKGLDDYCGVIYPRHDGPDECPPDDEVHLENLTPEDVSEVD